MTLSATPLGYDDMPWVDDAACRASSPDLFFPSAGRNGDREAKAVCARCPVRSECLAYALRTQQLDGVWGGMNSRERGRL